MTDADEARKGGKREETDSIGTVAQSNIVLYSPPKTYRDQQMKGVYGGVQHQAVGYPPRLPLIVALPSCSSQ